MRFYVYCLSDEPDAVSIEGLKGVGGSDARALAFGGAASIVAVVSEFKGERAAVTRENLRAHNSVNAHVLARSTPLPFRFGTLADESRLDEYVSANEGALADAFARVRGCVEMGVKLRVVEGAESSESSEVNVKEVRVEGASAARKAGGSGTAFLLAKRREILGEESLKARAEAAAARLAERVEGLARESDVRLNPEGPIVVRAAHLVSRADVSEYRARVRSFGASLERLHLLTSGPWPPYSFGVERG